MHHTRRYQKQVQEQVKVAVYAATSTSDAENQLRRDILAFTLIGLGMLVAWSLA